MPAPAAALGTTVSVPTLDGDEDVDVPAGTQPGTVVTLRERGMPTLGRGRRGDQQVVLNVVIPRNLSARQGLCNGTRLTVLALREHVIQCRVAHGPHAGAEVLLPRVTFTPSDAALPFRLRRRQLPVRLCFAMTINRAQGQTLELLAP